MPPTPDRSLEQRLLEEAEVVAVVGLSRSVAKDSRVVAGHLQRNGYRIVPIHPEADELLGETVYPSIADLPEEVAAAIDVVNVFRPSGELGGIVDQALAHLPNLKGVWAQKGIVDEEAAERARAAGVDVVQDRCIRTQHLFGKFAQTEA